MLYVYQVVNNLLEFFVEMVVANEQIRKNERISHKCIVKNVQNYRLRHERKRQSSISSAGEQELRN